MTTPTTPTATIITDDPIIAPIAQMALMTDGILEMARWIQRYRPQCVPEDGFHSVTDLVPHDGTDIDPEHPHPKFDRAVSDNEMLAELAGRKCYDSFADAGARRTNSEYLLSMWSGRIPHRSTGYHPKMSFFIAHVSRRVSHELIRNYVGSDRDEEGSPSQESTRFTHHPGVYIAHPAILKNRGELSAFTANANTNYQRYVETIRHRTAAFVEAHGEQPKGLDRKRIYESCAGDLLMSCGTSFIWTTNPMALTKFFHERDDEAADMEMCRFARAWKRVCLHHWPNLFQEFWPKEAVIEGVNRRRS